MNNLIKEDRFYTLEEFAKRLSVDLRTLRPELSDVKLGGIPVFKVGRQFRISEKAWNEYAVRMAFPSKRNDQDSESK